MRKRKRPSRSAIPGELQINGETWHRVQSLADSAADDRHFVGSTDQNGVTILQFGDGKHGARLPVAADRAGAADRSSRNYVGVVLQQGRVILDTDWHEGGPAATRLCGLYRGIVTDNADPTSQARVKVRVPAILGNQPVWALPCRPVGAAAVPTDGASVWVSFEGGDPSLPVWLGSAD